MLEGHDSTGLNPPLLQRKLGNLVNAATFTSFRDALGNLPGASRPPEAGNPFRGIETRDFARARHRCMMGGGALAFLRVHVRSWPNHAAKEICFHVTTILERRTIYYIRVPFLWSKGRRHAPRAYMRKVSPQVTQHQPLKRLAVKQMIEAGAPFTANRDSRWILWFQQRSWKRRPWA